MTKKQKAYKLAADLGAEITDYGNCLDLWSPPRKSFDGETHIRSYDLEWDGRKGLWQLVIEDLQTVRNCQIADCENCEAEKVGA